MAVDTETRVVSYTGDGATDVFTVSFYFLADAELEVVLSDTNGDPTVQVLDTDYTVAGAGETAGTGEITFTSPPTLNYTVTIRRVVEHTQAVEFRAQGAFAPGTHEDALDRLAFGLQQEAPLKGTFAFSATEWVGTGLRGLATPGVSQATGVCRVSFDVVRDTFYKVLVTPHYDSGGAVTVAVDKTTDYFDVYLYQGGSGFDGGFDVVVVD